MKAKLGRTPEIAGTELPARNCWLGIVGMGVKSALGEDD